MAGETDGYNITQVFEQYTAWLENVAGVLTSYYNSLIAEGMPDDLARDLVLDLQDRYLSGTLGKAD